MRSLEFAILIIIIFLQTLNKLKFRIENLEFQKQKTILEYQEIDDLQVVIHCITL